MAGSSGAGRNVTELLAGAAVLLVAAGFLGYAIAHTGRVTVSGYMLTAKFEKIDGLTAGADVRLAGVKVGSITRTSVDPKSYRAVVDISVESDLKLPRDSSAEISTDGLLGGKVIALVPGGDDVMLKNGGEITITQSAASLEDLLGKFIFGVNDLTNEVKKSMKPQAPAK